jgi:hypothetical protein
MRIRDPGWRQFGSGIRDGKKSEPGSGINNQDPQHCKKHCFQLNVDLYLNLCSYLDVKLETGWGGGTVLALITRMFDQLVDGLLVDVQRTGCRGLHEK